MTDFRTDPLSGTPVVVIPSRQKRPNLPADGCPFCPGGLEAPEPYDVRWFVNRWPALPDDRAEVVLYSPHHDASFWSLGVDGALAVVDVWAERTAALAARADVAAVLVFENRGPEVGATIAHPHGQIYAFDAVPPVQVRELDGDSCAVCTEAPEEAVVSTRGSWRAWVPLAPSWPYELLLAGAAHVPDLPSLGAEERRALAALLVDALARLDQLFDRPMPYMLWVHQRPVDDGDWPTAHLHVHIAPLWRDAGVNRFVAAGELGSGIMFNPLDPATAAARLRGLPGVPDPEKA